MSDIIKNKHMKIRKALICVDLQNDFMPGGLLPVPDGDKIIPVINKLLPKFDLIIFTKDWHFSEMHGCETYQKEHYGKKAFEKYINEQGQEDIIWPDHCIQDTKGAEFHDDLDLSKCKKDFYIFKKGTMPHYHPYSGFGERDENENSELGEFLRERGVEEIYVCGLAGDYCCKDTAIDGAFQGFTTYFILDAIKFIGNSEDTMIELFEAGVKAIDTTDLHIIL
jgi:nicotinamidase/pyrazinamidase